jgi:hypothetical protein
VAQLASSQANWWHMLYMWKGKITAIYKVVRKNGKNLSIPSGHLTVELKEQPQLTVYQMVTFLHLDHGINAHNIYMNTLKVAVQNVKCLITKICV